MLLSSEEIAEIINAKKVVLNAKGLQVKRLITDTRKLSNSNENTLFIALKGKNHDAHNFLEQAYQAGVRNFIVEKKTDLKDASLWIVDNTVKALQDLAIHHRSKFPKLPVIGITGSNGKTIVKEWLNYLLKHDFNIVRSPKSYNSQIGVPLSVLNIKKKHELAIFEAGISEMGEMEKLQKIIQPNIGLFTHLGSAHAIGFESKKEKFKQKLNLFKEIKQLVIDEKLINHFSDVVLPAQAEVNKFGVPFEIHHIDKRNNSTQIDFTLNKERRIINVNYLDEASINNIKHCLSIIALIKPDFNNWKLFETLPAISMRLELKKGINNTKIINDAYNADLDSLKIALDFLNQQSNKNKSLVLSELSFMKDSFDLRANIMDLLTNQQLNKLVTIGTAWDSMKTRLSIENFDYFNYPNLEELISDLKSLNFNNETVLVKGERTYSLEQLIEVLSEQKHETVLEINLDAIRNNLALFRSKLDFGTKVMVMVKSFAYGAGAIELAQLLEYQKVDCLGVAYVDEGIELRKAGITLPIMVMNCNYTQFQTCIQFNLEPVIYCFEQLNNWLKHTAYTDVLPLHIKVNTGMNRLGFDETDIPDLLEIIDEYKPNIQSMLSHLSASDSSKNKLFTLTQLRLFKKICNEFELVLERKIVKHILNSNGVLNYEDHQFDMVRLGLGLYGYIKNDALVHCLTLRTFITQIRKVEPGEYIGYGLKKAIQKNKYIATIGIGYADGLMRKAGNGNFNVWINGKTYPTIGSICMDMCMIDLGDNPHKVSLNVEVIIFSPDHSIELLAKSCGTISYEIMSNISQRVERVYWQEQG